MNRLNQTRRKSPFRMIILGFLITIVIGSLLLMLPFSTADGKCADALDALFTSTSATCVTGLVVQNTATYWSGFGKAVILGLIQIGGLGIVTIVVLISILSGRKIGFFERNTMKEAISAQSVGGIIRLTGFVFKISLSVELLGTIIMYPVFYKRFGIFKGLLYSFFHSVSAFCNAGFDLMGLKKPFSSLTEFSGQPLINLVVVFLIVFGGIGFLTWDDIRHNKFRIRRYRMQSKVILTVTAILILLPAIYFYFVEFSKPIWSSLSGSEKIWSSLFQSVTLRTAGFNTVDLSSMSSVSHAIMIVWMLIGGSPGSTAGGMKTTTVAVLFISAFSAFRKKNDANCFGRRIATETIRYAAAIFIMYITLFGVGGFIISSIEGLPLKECLFETASALGTVGLSLGITTELGVISKLILIALMFFGRVGGVTLVLAAISNNSTVRSKYPQERITVG